MSKELNLWILFNETFKCLWKRAIRQIIILMMLEPKLNNQFSHAMNQENGLTSVIRHINMYMYNTSSLTILSTTYTINVGFLFMYILQDTYITVVTATEFSQRPWRALLKFTYGRITYYDRIRSELQA